MVTNLKIGVVVDTSPTLTVYDLVYFFTIVRPRFFRIAEA